MSRHPNDVDVAHWLVERYGITVELNGEDGAEDRWKAHQGDPELDCVLAATWIDAVLAYMDAVVAYARPGQHRPRGLGL